MIWDDLQFFSLLCLQEEFGYNADTQKLLAKNGETLLGAINFFIANVNTLVNKTIEDTLLTVKQYESARYSYSMSSYFNYQLILRKQTLYQFSPCIWVTNLLSKTLSV